MRFLDLKQRVRSMTRDFSNSIFRDQDLDMYINEGIDRIKQIVPELREMKSLTQSEQRPNLLPEHYHHVLAVYCTSRCFAQDERHYQATTYMNEFEIKMAELKTKIENGEVIILDAQGNVVESPYLEDHVTDLYFKKQYRDME